MSVPSFSVSSRSPKLSSGKKFLKSENKIGKVYLNTLKKFNTNKRYDIVFTSHTNYYWAKKEKDYDAQLDKLIGLVKSGGKAMILTLPEKSDHYNIMLKQIYPKFNYAEYIIDYYKNKGLKVKVKRFNMRMYVGDILRTDKLFDLKTFYKFIHNTEEYPNKRQSTAFLKKIKKYQKSGYLDFKDYLIIVEK